MVAHYPSTPPTLTIEHASDRHTLGPGDSITVGRALADDSPTPDPHLALTANPRLHAHAATVTADEHGWVLTNTGRWLQLRVVELDGPNRLDVDPGRTLRVPYGACEVQVTLGDEVVRFRVRSSLAGAGSGAPAPAVSGSTVSGLGLDRGTGYFRALVALCEPRLRNPGSDEVASVGEIVRHLNRLDAEPERVTAKAVERRLAHVRSKLGVGGIDEHGVSAAGLEVRDSARQLVDLVLRTGTVTVEDLEGLDATPGPDR